MTEHGAKPKEGAEEARRCQRVQPVCDQRKPLKQPGVREPRQEREVSTKEQIALAASTKTLGAQRVEHMLGLQQTYGNKYVQRLAKGNGQVTLGEDIICRIEAQRGLGKSLEREVHSHKEVSFGHDFSDVRLHRDSEAGELSRIVGGQLFATGQDLFFGEGRHYALSGEGEKLLAHEATQVVQQAEGRVPEVPLHIRAPGDNSECGGDEISRQSDNGNSGQAVSLGAELTSLPCNTQRQIQLEAKPSQRLPYMIWDCVVDYRRKEIDGNPALQTVLMTLYLRIGPGLWEHIRQITWVGKTGTMVFSPHDEKRLQSALIGEGYTSSYFARGSDDTWGLREPNVEKAGLHWRGKPDGKVNVHIDLHPPSWTGFVHKIQDDWRRSKTHTPESLRAAVIGYVSVQDLQSMHERVAMRLKNVEKRVGSQRRSDVSVQIGLGYGQLQMARSIWAMHVASQQDLMAALCYLYQAGLHAELAEQLVVRQPTETSPILEPAGLK